MATIASYFHQPVFNHPGFNHRQFEHLTALDRNNLGLLIQLLATARTATWPMRPHLVRLFNLHQR